MGHFIGRDTKEAHYALHELICPGEVSWYAPWYAPRPAPWRVLPMDDSTGYTVARAMATNHVGPWGTPWLRIR